MKQPERDFVNDPYEVIDERFASVRRAIRGWSVCSTVVVGPRARSTCRAGRYLLFSDIPNDRIMRWDECTGAVGVFRAPSRHANGGTLDRQGRLVSCEHSGRRVTRTEHDGSLTVIADRFEGKRLNSPNDVVVRSDGSIWFTDPSYGIDSDYEGERAESEIGGCHVYSVDPSDGACRIVADDFVRPNGLAFSADERRLFVADTRVNHIRVFDVAEDGTLSGSREFAQCSNGVFDGFRLDDERPLVGGGGGRRALLRRGRRADRQDPRAGSRRLQRGLRRPQAQPPLHLATTAIYSVHLHASGLRT